MKSTNYHQLPLTEADFEVALALRRIVKQFGSLGAFHKHVEAERRQKNRELCDKQRRELSQASSVQ